MVEDTSLEDHLTPFKEIFFDLETMEVKYNGRRFRVDFVLFVTPFLFEFQGYYFV